MRQPENRLRAFSGYLSGFGIQGSLKTHPFSKKTVWHDTKRFYFQAASHRKGSLKPYPHHIRDTITPAPKSAAWR
ncbi:hypothetical protein [Kingella oralis]|uniref:hypothetical protein n=1 Tax=Kingella oralis TaxID=505 RepID=UPI0034E390CF